MHSLSFYLLNASFIMCVFSLSPFTFWRLSMLSLYLNCTFLFYLLSSTLFPFSSLVQSHLPVIPIHDLTFVTLRTGCPGTCNISWEITAWSGRSMQPIEKRKGEKFSFSGGWLIWEKSPHSPLDIWILRLINRTDVSWNISRVAVVMALLKTNSRKAIS